jgi:hypothetical protein
MKHYKLLLIIFFVTVITQPVFAQLKPGDIAPNAKVIDAEFFYPFNMGAAIVQKGSAFGLIDMNGNFLVPYNKYNRITPMSVSGGARITAGGIFMVDAGKGALNSKGVLITAAFPDLSWTSGSDDGKLIFTSNYKGGYLYLDAEGHQYFFKEYLEHIAEGIGIAKDNYKCGYKNLKGEWLVKPVYDYAEPFSEGMACVAKRNEFGETKWGFIDRTGKEVTGLIYTFKPENFHAGLARVQPKDNSQFLSAFIDKKGNIAQKFNTVVFYTYIGNGLYSGGANMMDSTGKLIPVKDFLQQLGIVMQPGDKSVNLGNENIEGVPYNDGKISYARLSKEPGHQTFGSVNIKTKEAIEGLFDAATTFHYFDPVSKLSFARFFISKDYRDKTPAREGYVNEQGVFVIIKGEASKW